MADNKESPSKEGTTGATQVGVNDEQEEKFRCSFCAQIFASRKEVLVHEWQHKERQTFSCTVCSRSFTNKNLFDRHVAMHNKLGQRGSLCNICNKTFRNHRELDKHHQKDHKGQKSFRCGICGLLYSWMDNLQKHMRVHVDKPIGCFRCHKSFRDEESLNQHALVHKREDVEKRAQGLPVTPSTQDTEDLSNIITIGMPGNLTTRIPAKSNVINVTAIQSKDIPVATNVVTLTKSAAVKSNVDKPTQAIGGTSSKGENEVAPAAVLDLADPQQMAALLEGYMDDDQLTSTAETIDMINALSVDASAAKAQLNTGASTMDKSNNKSHNKLQKESDKSSPSISPKQGVKTITYTLARSGANTITSSTTQQSISVPKTNEINLGTQTLTEGTNNVIINGTLKGSTVTVVSTVMATPTGSINYTSSNTKHTDTGTGPISASETKLLEQMDKPHRCHVCGECFKYEFTLNAHMPKHKEALPAWESRGVLVPYGAGVKSVVLPKAMPIKPYGCPVCKETFRYDSCLKAHFMKSHPAEYKEKYGVDPKVIQALNVPNPRYKRPYHRKAVQRPDGDRTDKQMSENQTPKLKTQQKVEKDKLRKKIDSLVIEAPRPTPPKSKKDRLRPMPPHLLKKEMEAQEARERAEKERLDQEEAERIRLEKEEEERLKREEEEKRMSMAQEKVSLEDTSPIVPMTTVTPVDQQSVDTDANNATREEQMNQVETNATHNEENMDVGKPLFIVPLFNNQVTIDVANNIQQPAQTQNINIPSNILTQNDKPSETEPQPSQDFSGRKVLETTTIDLSQLKEVTTPIIEEVLHKSPFKIEENAKAQLIEKRTDNSDTEVTEEESVKQSDKEFDQPTGKLPETSCAQTSHETPSSQIERTFNDETNEESSSTTLANIDSQSDNSYTTPKKSPPKSRKPRTPKSAEPAHRILTRRKYAHEEEARFKAEREAAQQEDIEKEQHARSPDESMQIDQVSSTDQETNDIISESDAMEVTSDSKENEVKFAEDGHVNNCDLDQNDRTSEVTSTVTSNNDLEVNDSVNAQSIQDSVDVKSIQDSVDLQSIQSESANSVVSMDTNKAGSENGETLEVESQKSSSVEQNNDNAQSIKSDGQSEDGLETIVIILKESETNNKNTGTVEQNEGSDSLENNPNKNRSIEEWIDKTEGKEDSRSRKGKHMLEMSETAAVNVGEEPRALRRSTRSANEQKQTENQQTDSPRVLRKRTLVKDDQGKNVTSTKGSERNLRSSPQKDTLKTSVGRALRRHLSPSSVERKDSRSKSVDRSKNKMEVEIKLKKCSIALVDNILPKDKFMDQKKRAAGYKSACSENKTNFRSRLRRKLLTESVDDGQKKELVGKHDEKKSEERTLRRRTSTESVESRDGNLNSSELGMTGGRVLRRRPSANSLDDNSRSRSSSCPRRVRELDKGSKMQQDEETRKSARQLRRRLSPEKKKEMVNTTGAGKLLRRRNSHTYHIENKRETSIENESKRSGSENSKSARRLRSSRSSSWEEQAKALAKCSVKLQRCDTPVKQLEADEKEKEVQDDTASMDVDTSRKRKLSEHSFEIITDSAEMEDAEKDPLQSVLEKETELVLNHIQREKETRAAEERKAQEEAASVADEKNEEASEKDSIDTALDRVSVASEVSVEPESEVTKQIESQSSEDLQQENRDENKAASPETGKEKSTKETTVAEEVKENKESRKPKKTRSKKQTESNNIYELLRQQKDKIQTKVLSKIYHEISPREKKSSPSSSKKSSPDFKKSSLDNKKSPSESSISPEQNNDQVSRSKGRKKRKRKDEECVETNVSKEVIDDETPVEKEIGIIIPVENAKTCPVKQKSPNKIKTAEERKENNSTDSDDNEDLNQLLELATGRTLRSEVKSPVKDETKHVYSSGLRQDASDFEKAVHLSLLEAKKSRKEKKKKKKKKHKREKRDSSPFSLPESCDHSVKPKKKKKKKHKHRDSPKEEKLLDLSEEQVELLEQSFELMMPDLFRQLTIESPTGTDGEQSFNVSVNVENKSKKDKKQSPSNNKQTTDKKSQDTKSPARENKSPHTDHKKSTNTLDKIDSTEIDNRSKTKSTTQSPKSPKNKKFETPTKSKNKNSKTKAVPEIREDLTRTTRAKLAMSQAIEFQKQIEQNIPEAAEDAASKVSGGNKDASDRKATRKAEKEKLTKKDKYEVNKDIESKHKKQNKEKHKKHEDKSSNSKDTSNRDRNYDKRDKHEKRRDYEKRPRTENLFLQDISQTPKFFEHNIPLTNSLSQVPPAVAPIAPVQFPTLTDPSRKRGLDGLLHAEPPAKIPAIENDIMNNAPPPKRKRGRPSKASKLKNTAPPTQTVIPTSSAVSLTPHIAPVFSHSLATNVFGSTPSVESPIASEPKEKSSKKGRKRKRGSSGRIEIRGQEIVYMEEKDSTSENSLGADVGTEAPVIGELEIKQEVESSEAEDTCNDAYPQPNEAEEGREVIMVSVATMTDSSYLMDLRKMMLEQEQMEVEAAASEMASTDKERESDRKGSNSPRLTVKLYRCDYCTRPFTQRSWMVLHKLREHGYSCQSQAIYMHTLARRVMRRVLIEWRRYGCETCHRRFNHKAHYIFHQSTEHRRKQYRCGVCNLSSDSYMLYQMHAVFVHKAVMMK